MLVALLCNLSVFAQENKLFKNFGIDNPISYQFVMTIAQDKDGFMWFGAEEGLHRFDGYQLVSFHHDATQPHSLSSNVISRILTDKNQRLWVGTRGGGLNLYRENTKDFEHINTKSADLSLSDDNVNSLLEDSSGNLWIGTDNGVNILSNSEGTWTVKQIYQELGKPNSLSHNMIHSIIETNEHQIWVGTNGGGISVFDLQGNFIKVVKYGDRDSSTYIGKFINSLYSDAQGNIWIGTVESGLLLYNPKSELFTHFQFNENDTSTISSNRINNIYQGAEQNIWIATDNGLSIYQPEVNKFIRYNHTLNNPYSVSNDYILTFFEDNNKMMWVGTFTGVNRWDPTMMTFNRHTVKNNPELVSSNITSFVQVDDNKTIFSTYSGGVYQRSNIDKKVTRIDFNEFFSDLRIMTLFADDNNLWIGTRASGLYKVNLISNFIVK